MSSTFNMRNARVGANVQHNNRYSIQHRYSPNAAGNAGQNMNYAVPDHQYQQYQPSTSQVQIHPVQPIVEAENDEGQVLWRPIPLKLVYFGQFTGMPIVQVNGQRFYGPPRNYPGPPPPRGSEVFVGALPRDCDEVELVPIFGSIGQIYRIRLMMDFSGTNRGFCFVQYFTVEDATQAIIKLNKYQIRPDKCIGVFRSVDNSRLQVTGVPRQLKSKDIYEEVRHLSEGLVHVTLAPRARFRHNLKNTAILEFDSHRSAAMVRRSLMNGGLSLGGVPVTVEWARPVQTK